VAAGPSLDPAVSRSTLGATFDTEAFLAACQDTAVADGHHGVRELLQRTMSTPNDVAEALRPDKGGLTTLLQSDDLTVIHVVWAPGMRIYPHDHRMWAVLGIYAGQEDNSFYRRAESDRRHLVESGGKELRTGDVLTLGDDTIHAVANPTSGLTGAIHVYGGDFVNQPRSQWGPGPMEERPHDYAVTLEQFAAANRAWLAATT
jgi:predicted metal-dependent enzyme (double-stranded beta helix superfamily)